MNLFIIPSWYPDKLSTMAGIFIKEQAMALGECRPDWNVALSLWGHGTFYVSLEYPLRSVLSIIELISHSRQSKQPILSNVIEYGTNCIEWNNKYVEYIFEANMRSCERNFTRFSADFGKVDIIHAHVSYPAGWIAMRLSQKTGVPYVITEHMCPFPFSPFVNKDGSLHDKVRLPLEKADSVIAVSPSLSDRISSFGIKPPIYIPNVVDERFFTPELPPQKSPKYTFFTLGRMTPQKGILDLLQSIKSFVDRLSQSQRNNISFRIGGEGVERLVYEKAATEMGLNDCLSWLGLLTREQSKHEFQNCNCFVLASHNETFGVVFAEAIACGKPIIATRCGGPEVIVTEQNGILVDVSNVSQFSDAMFEVYSNASKYSPEVIRKQFIEMFSRTVVVTQLEEIYFNILKKRDNDVSLKN